MQDPELRSAIIELGRGLSQHDPEFIEYRQRLLAEHKPPLVAAVAVGRRAHRLAFAMMRDGRPYEPDRWTRSVVGKAVMVNIEVHQNDVPCPPSASLNQRRRTYNTSSARR